MPELLLELFSEEIPARLQRRAAGDLERLVTDGLKAEGLKWDGVKAFSTPRRLTLVITGLPVAQADLKEERKGPRVGAPEKAVEGFLNSAGLESLDQAQIHEDKKGQFYVAVIERTGQPTAQVIAGMMPEIIAKFPWPKSMRWGAGDMRWVRPLHSILCTFDGEVVPFTIENGDLPVTSGDKTYGHRFIAPEEIQVRSFEPYAAELRRARVLLDPDEREELILGEARALAKAQGLELVEDKGLLAEVAGLSEWPVPRIGNFAEKFLTVPDEALIASMKGHQKYFSVINPQTGRLAPKFITVANIEPADGGAAMMVGYERVLEARLSDAWFLYHQDLKKTLEQHGQKLSEVTFFEGLGTTAEKVERVAALAKELAPIVGADPALAEKAALLSKSDLTTEMVGEFPELQGIMGRYYALEENIEPEIADAIRDHYKPAGQNDDVPTAPVSVAVALADKLDSLVAFWVVNKKPTGSSDPFALRRAALGIIQIVLKGNVRFSLYDHFSRVVGHLIEQCVDEDILSKHDAEQAAASPGEWFQGNDEHELLEHPVCTLLGYGPNDADVRLALSREELHFIADPEDCPEAYEALPEAKRAHDELTQRLADMAGLSFALSPNDIEPIELSEYLPIKRVLPLVGPDLLAFFHDRLSVYLRDQGYRHDHIRSVLTPDADDFVLVVKKLEALKSFLDSEDGANLTAAYKRAGNILKAEAKKGDLPQGEIDEAVLEAGEEKTLHARLAGARDALGPALAGEKYEAAMLALAGLRAPLDAFFEKVTVNADDPALRRNRLLLLGDFISTCGRVAQFSELEG
ncbi:glycine--tRNA ligase subunit beta [Parvularcula marina]|uniref:Glycine--tRNA ligase beta subunit n=1 Tax=Parvularcula marina TaxID=2292771 RepID=A0A371RLU5_9PROT|nr:glycine--tRNA ligase subunit beta [Parvularcula marina]RFB06435.1 glycine--tRNA ligase subunit beta [Parvularcula marina]